MVMQFIITEINLISLYICSICVPKCMISFDVFFAVVVIFVVVIKSPPKLKAALGMRFNFKASIF